jgi:flagellar assembly protein FliH
MLRLEVFEHETAQNAREPAGTDPSQLEEAKLASYDAGYAAGWEDAAAALGNDQARIHADLARNLQTLSFTYEEARSHVLRGLEPLLEQIVATLLPSLARETLGGVVLDALMPLAATLADQPVTLVLNPAAQTAVEPLIASATGLPLSIVQEPSLGEGQVYLRFDRSEMLVDLDRATAEIATAVRSFFELTQKDDLNG